MHWSSPCSDGVVIAVYGAKTKTKKGGTCNSTNKKKCIVGAHRQHTHSFLPPTLLKFTILSCLVSHKVVEEARLEAKRHLLTTADTSVGQPFLFAFLEGLYWLLYLRYQKQEIFSNYIYNGFSVIEERRGGK